ncbi:hypothetical protein OJF2_77600 [Aquisphaera giovannonii]|uniref:Nickel uptake substrate-specific transmembrane region n=1 Tax=Aquisphaera giovannonii TaxID=406548 RepID=A0A5B9WES0_9BACT|nr:hypothetical protein [Aquisphaera giovannonii]QEH39148.1 hypothetical protein OJF2_77600 [Aquisphaera giovannonii]
MMLALCGCGSGQQGPAIIPVSGKVLVDGKPAARARLSFQALGAADPSAPPTIATTEEDGTFRPTTINAHDGMPAGEYAVGVAWPAIKEDRGEEIEGADRLKGRYASPASSGLKAVVKEGGGELPPFELSTTRKATGTTREGHAR